MKTFYTSMCMSIHVSFSPSINHPFQRFNKNKIAAVTKCLFLIFLAFVIGVSPIKAQVTIGSTALPNLGAVLDLNNANATAATYKGVLLPQVALTSTIVYGLNTLSTALPVNGMLVYNKLAAGSGATAVAIGVYIWQAGAWNIVNVGAMAGDNLGNHTATKDLNMQGNGMVGTADTITNGILGIGITHNGGLNIGDNPGQNIFVGAHAGFKNVFTTDVTNPNYPINYGFQNQFIGFQSGYNNTSGNGNLFTGYQSGYLNTTGNKNTFYGAYSGVNITNNRYAGNTTGSGNTFIGYYSGATNRAGILNTAIGMGAGPASESLINTSSIGFGATATVDNTIQMGNSQTIYVITSGSFQNYSDARLKYDVQQNVPGLAFINKLRPVTYRFDDLKADDFAKTGVMALGFHENRDAIIKTGFLAQEVEIAAKQTGFNFDAIHVPIVGSRDIYSLSYAQFVVPLVKAVQELNGEVEALKAENARLKAVEKANIEMLERMTKMEKLIQSFSK